MRKIDGAGTDPDRGGGVMDGVPPAIARSLRSSALVAAGFYLGFAALWIFASDGLLALVVDDPALLVGFGAAKGFFFVAATAVLIYLLPGWHVPAPTDAHPGTSLGQARRVWQRQPLAVVFVSLALVVPVVGFVVIKLQQPRAEERAVNDLRAIAALKAAQVESWLRERDGDARVLRGGRLGSQVEQWLRDGDPEARDAVVAATTALRHDLLYEVELLAPDGRRLLASAAPDELGVIRRELLPAALRSGQVEASDLYRDDGGRVRLDYVVPLFTGGAGTQRIVAVVVLRAPVVRVLFPALQTWPTRSRSGEVVLVRRDGDRLLVLNDLRHRAGSALNFRLPAQALEARPAQTDAAAVAGIDYRGVAVLSATRAVAGSSWQLLAKVDRREVLLPLLEMTFWVGLVALIAVAAVAAVVSMLWREQQRASALERVAQAAEKDKLLKLFCDLPFAGMALTSPTTNRFLYVNERFCTILDQPREALMRLDWRRLVRAERSGATRAELDRLLAGEIDGFGFERNDVRADGQPITVQVDVKCVRGPDGGVELLVAMVQDITARKHAEARTREAATVFESTRDGVIIAALDGSIRAVNRAFTEVTGYTEDEVRGRNPKLLQSGRQDAAFYEAMWASILAEGQWRGEIWNRRKNGEVYPAWTSITTVRDEHGQPSHYVGVFTDVGQLKRSEEQRVRLAHFDPLTDLPNRQLLHARLAHAVERAQQQGQRLAVLFIDLDRFKTVNDSLGHLVGDQLLLAAAQRLRLRARAEDTLGRLGGDEFLLILSEIADPQDAAVVARDVQASLAAAFALPSGHEVFVGASIGISVFPDDAASAAELLRDADAALHQAKEQGSGRFCFYMPDMNGKARMQLELETALRRALERNEFLLHYQPKVDLATGLVSGAEALIRWRRSGGGLEAPMSFIPLAERSGLIVDIGAWVIDEACRQLRQWHDAGRSELAVAVNVSARQFQSHDLAETVARALERHGVAAACLELELTESMLMEDPGRTLAILGALKRIGVQISLDDFGTGYSSFAYLSRFPIDCLKIDRSFVRDVATEPASAMIAVSIIELAHRMQLRVVAEGVETEAELGYLKRQRCDEMQGFYFSRPLPAAEFAALLDAAEPLSAPLGPEAVAARTLLVVDDDPGILAALRRQLRREGYRVLTAGSAAEGLELLAKNAVQVVLSDQRMPNVTGTEFLRRVKLLYPDTVRIVLSGYAELGAITEAVNEGAIYKFLFKPWDDGHLREQLREAFLYQEAVVRSRAAVRPT